MSEVDAKAAAWLKEALALRTEEDPFPWQVALLGRFVGGAIDRARDIPTGLGKTAVMAIWLVARATGAKLPRRLVYVVDRRGDGDAKVVVVVDSEPAPSDSTTTALEKGASNVVKGQLDELTKKLNVRRLDYLTDST